VSELELNAEDHNLQPTNHPDPGNIAVPLDGCRRRVSVDSGVVFVKGDNVSPMNLSRNVENILFLKDLTGLDEVQVLSSSRFGSTKLLRRRTSTGEWEEIVGKFYNVGDNRDSSAVFFDQVNRFVPSLSHRHVLSIIGLIAPTKTSGPIVLTEYRKDGSLLDVLGRVELNDPPDFWNEAGKLRMILSLISGLKYLHSQGIVHRELKPSDLIVSEDGSIETSDYLTSFFEDKKYTKASQVGAPSYMAPEIYEDRSQMNTKRNPSTDVFSFALILFEILFESKVFPASLSAPVIMRKAMGSNRGQLKARDRPVIRTTIHKVLQELISWGWNQHPEKRPTFEEMWMKLQDVEFKVFPNVCVEFSHPVPVEDSNQKKLTD
jgi:serine/threonine protein kinase